MPTFGDAVQFFGGQFFGTTTIPGDLDLSGKTIVITGGNTGLGLECAKHLVNHGLTRLILACRDVQKGEAAKLQILQGGQSESRSAEIDVWTIDLSSYESVAAFGQRLMSDLPRLDGFIANAGVEMKEFKLAEGLELSLTVNVISTFLSGLLALQKLRETSRLHDVQTNLVFVGSLIHAFGPDASLDVPAGQDIFEHLSDASTSDMDSRYPLSKLIEHLCFVHVVSLLDQSVNAAANDKVVVNLVNPGWCKTELGRFKTQKALPEMIFEPIVARTAEQGSRTLVHGVTAGPETHAQYVSECQVKQQSSFVRSEKGKLAGEMLWRQTMSRIMRVVPDVESRL